MNWHDTIEFIRKNPEYEGLVDETFIRNDLVWNVEAFSKSEEFQETLKVLKECKILPGSRILDVGAGNGIACISFAIKGYLVTALEPDLSDSVGAEAIKWLKEHFKIEKISLVSSFGEDMPFEDDYFDLVYARQVMHHAYNLPEFAKSMYRVVKKGGYLFTVRDHVISNDKEKESFFKIHPLHKFYGGENAFKLEEYTNALNNAGFEIKKIFDPTESIINLSPWSKKRFDNVFRQKFGSVLSFVPILALGWHLNKIRLRRMPGRLYSVLSQKN